MKAIALVLMTTYTLFGFSSPQEDLSTYYARNTLQEILPGDKTCETIYINFSSDAYSPFFSELETLLLQQDLTLLKVRSALLPQTMEKMDYDSKKLHRSILSFRKKHPFTFISSFLKKWDSFHFSKEEKETIAYFNALKREKCLDTTSLKGKLSSLLVHCDLMKDLLVQHKKEYSPFYMEHGAYLLELYTHHKMLQLLDEDFEPLIFHHIETYLEVAKKKASFFYDTHLLHQFTQGEIAPSTEEEILAKNLLKPYFKKLDDYIASS